MHPLRAILGSSLLAGVVVFLGCGGTTSVLSPSTPAPSAAFTYSPTTPSAGQLITFTDASTGAPTSWAWNFGDGGTSTLKDPTHGFVTAGDFTVTLVATNAGGNSTSTRTVTVTSVGTAPTAAFTFAPSAPQAGQSLAFTDTSTGSPSSWAWNFGDGSASTLQNPTHTYAAAGTYTATLTATNAKGSTSASHPVTVSATSAFTLSSTVGSTLPIDYTFDGSGASPDLTWSGAPAGTKEYALLMTTLPGDGSTLWNWVLYAIPASANALAKNTSGVGLAGMTSHSVAAYAPPQSTGPGTKTYTFTLYALSASPTLPSDPTQVTGSMLSQAIANLTLGSTTLSVSYARSAPVSAFTSSASGNTVTFANASGLSASSYAWNFGDGSTSTEKNPSHTYATQGSFVVSLVATNGFGSNTSTKTLTLGTPSLPSTDFFIAPTPAIAAQSTVFTDLTTGTPTSWAWNFGDGGTSTLQHPSHTYATAGTYTVTLTSSNAGGSKSATQSLTVGAAVPSTAKMNMAQTISDQAQRTTLAFSGLAMITGNLESQSFYPPGKVADYTGFQFLRDNDPSDMGHNTSFLTRVANNVIYILNTNQLSQLAALATTQQTQFELYGYQRFALMKAFRRALTGDLPTGATGLNLNAVKKASNALYLIDGQISYDRALLYANIYASLDATQKAYLDAMVGKGWSAWPDITDAQIQDKMKALPKGSAVAVMTYASDIFSWYAGNVEADVYFCPERQGTYYGGFYMKDAPAIGHEGYSIDQQLTATAGEALSNASKGYVTQAQATVMSSLVEAQRANLYGSSSASIVKCRTEIATLLRALRTSTTNAATIKARVLELSGIYGDLDGANNHAYATIFAQVYATLSTDQKTKLMDLRKSIMAGKYADGTPFDFTTCTTPYLYSAPITDLNLLAPYIANTDYLFFEP